MSRRIFSLASLPGTSAATRVSMLCGSVTALPSTCSSTSPGRTPPLSAGPPRITPAISVPDTTGNLNDSANSGVISCASTPIQPRVTLPVSMMLSITCRALEAGIAKPMPMDPPDCE